LRYFWSKSAVECEMIRVGEFGLGVVVSPVATFAEITVSAVNVQELSWVAFLPFLCGDGSSLRCLIL